MKKARYSRVFKQGIRLMDSIINGMVLLLFLGVTGVIGYGIWDAGQLYGEAKGEHYEQYRPRERDDVSFARLQEQNPDVFGWLTVYGTHMDYPLVQGRDNNAYVNTSVTGEALLSGSIFLDYRNRRDLSDFNSIIYGHHMDHQVMFGEIGDFAREDYFQEHAYGTIYAGGRYYGLTFFAFLQADAYDRRIYTPGLMREEERAAYLTHLFQEAWYTRDIPVGPTDRLVLLSTCTSDRTNGRHILVGKLSETIPEDPFGAGLKGQFDGRSLPWWLKQVPVWLWMLLILAVISLTAARMYRKRRGNNE